MFRECHMKGELLVERLIAYAEMHLHLQPCDVIYARNCLLSEFRLSAPYDGEADISDIAAMEVPDALSGELAEYALEHNLATEETVERYCADIFGNLTPLPSVVNSEFARQNTENGDQTACDYLYNISVRNGYIQKTAIAKNLKWEYRDSKNTLEITINLSKPEKNNRDIAKLLTAAPAKKYPMCALCKENEGFEGTATHPPRRNLRTVKMTLGGEKWFMQYSPYAYYDEHCIVISEKHTPMKVDVSTPGKLLDFVDILPNYFIGSNASLPIIGGSILNHEHFQGGLHRMPMHYAGYRKMYASAKYPQLKIGVLEWYNNVIQCESSDRKAVSGFMSEVISEWKKFSCPSCDILSETNGVSHNSLSPICSKKGDTYIFSAILRNNRTDEQFPDGIFHAHPEFHNIKSEGIGLIELMGLFILPGRLKRQLDEVEDILCGIRPYNEKELFTPDNDLYIHRNMIKEFMDGGMSETKKDAHLRVEEHVNRVCAGILDNTAVFKRDETGETGFASFLNKLGLTERQ